MITVSLSGLVGGRVGVSLAVLPATIARAHVAQLLADGARPSYLAPHAEWVDARDVPAQCAAEVVLTVDGPRGTAYAGARLRVHLSFPPAYPAHPPLVRFGSQLHHEQVLEGGLVGPPFYAALGWERKPARHVRTVMAEVHQLLVAPLPTGSRLSRATYLRIAQLQRLRTHTISAYAPLRTHGALFAQPPALLAGWVEPRVLAACDARDDAAIRSCVHELAPGVFSLALFTPALCGLLLDELRGFERTGLPASRPNSMNRHGVIVDEIGMERLMDELRVRLVCPLAEALFTESDQGGSHSLDHHHAFSVTYTPSADTGLDMHHDDSEVTLNVCLGSRFEGAGLTFCGRFGETTYRKHIVTYAHQPGRAVLHLGRQRHGADTIVRGERSSLIVWARSSSYRARAPDEPPMHQRVAPDLCCLSYTHDIDYETWQELPPGVVGKRERLAKLRAMGGG
ncbi:hypothetical protein KFE25_003772 [Diacronema lutheri]|uniref:Fe2OG dioxygenase domain-containing protein n=1 Tax=Diacronema lutheri TaxID=2081491 RepID=A0A8J5X6X5_DIALT|nr:hypothetical protein KFE25_003772 [Diacronema lutheri]